MFRWLNSKKIALINLFIITIFASVLTTLLLTGKIGVLDDIFAGRRRRARYRISSNTAIRVQNTFRQIAKKVRPAVVTIQTFANSIQLARPDLPPFFRKFFGYRISPNTPINIGSGFIIDRRGYIITNYHVVKKSTRILVRMYNGKVYKASIVGFDSGIDLAVLKINARRNVHEVAIGNSKKIRVGDWAIAIGNPSGYEGTFTVGVIGGKNRTEDTTGIFQNYIQTDASINPGNSGGPLIDINGKVIGVNSWIHSRTGQSSGINFAIPINTVINYLSELIRRGRIERNGYIGISLRDARRVNPNLTGGYVVSVEKNGPAYKAGIRKGDFILALNGIYIDSVLKYMRLIVNSRIGEIVRFTVRRRNKRRIFKVKVGRENINKSFLKIRVEELNPQHRRRLGLFSNDVGVIILEMANDSPLKKAGFKVGDLIFMVENKVIRNVLDYKIMSSILSNKNLIFIKAKRKNRVVIGQVYLKENIGIPGEPEMDE